MQRTRRTDINLTLKASVSTIREVIIQLNVTNNTPSDYWIDNNVVEGLQNKPFSIYGGPSRIYCSFHTGHYYFTPNFSLIKSGEKVTGSAQLLSDICNFKDAAPGKYILSFNKGSSLYTFDQYTLHQNNCTPIGPIEYFQERLESPIILGEYPESDNIIGL